MWVSQTIAKVARCSPRDQVFHSPCKNTCKGHIQASNYQHSYLSHSDIFYVQSSMVAQFFNHDEYSIPPFAADQYAALALAARD